MMIGPREAWGNGRASGTPGPALHSRTNVSCDILHGETGLASRFTHVLSTRALLDVERGLASRFMPVLISLSWLSHHASGSHAHPPTPLVAQPTRQTTKAPSIVGAAFMPALGRGGGSPLGNRPRDIDSAGSSASVGPGQAHPATAGSTIEARQSG